MELKEKLNSLLVKFNLKVEDKVEDKVDEVIVDKVEVEKTEDVIENEKVEEIKTDEKIDEAHEEAEKVVEIENNEIDELKNEVAEMKNSIKDLLEVVSGMNQEIKEDKVVIEEKINEVADQPADNSVQFSAETSSTDEIELTETEKRINNFNENYDELYNFLADQATMNGKEIKE